MKKLLALLILFSVSCILVPGQTGAALEVGMKAPAWKFTDAQRVEYTMDSWAGKVLQINYVDPDESDLNDSFNDAISTFERSHPPEIMFSRKSGP